MKKKKKKLYKFTRNIAIFAFLLLVISKALGYALDNRISQLEEEIRNVQNEQDVLIMKKNEFFSYDQVIKDNPNLKINQNIIKIKNQQE